MPKLPQYAISIRQPYAWLICAGIKPVENRTWRTTYRGPIAIHTGIKPCARYHDVCDEIRKRFGVTVPEGLPLGGIVGAATLSDCVTRHPSDWFDGPFGFVMTSPRHLTFTAMDGALNVFRFTARAAKPVRPALG